MSWLLAVLYLATGVALGVGGIFFGFTRTLARRSTRRIVLRQLAEYWPEELEDALGHMSILHPTRDTDPGDTDPGDTDPDFSAIDFHQCDHCQLPWPLDDQGKLPQHQRIVAGPPYAWCQGSGTKDFDGSR